MQNQALQVFIYKSSPEVSADSPRLFFVRAHDPRLDDVAIAQKDSDTYKQSKFNQYLDRVQIDSVKFYNKTQKELIDMFEAPGWICLNVKRI